MNSVVFFLICNFLRRFFSYKKKSNVIAHDISDDKETMIIQIKIIFDLYKKQV